MKENKKKWKIYIVAHDCVISDFLTVDPAFNCLNYEILNVGNRKYIKNPLKLKEIDQKRLKSFFELGKWWAESEGIYNIWKSKVYKELDYIGFIHYDLELKYRDRINAIGNSVSKRVNKILEKNDKAHISFETHDVRKDYAQKIMADFSRPNTLQGDGMNCYDYILAEYNEFFNTTYSISDLFNKKKINLCSCFMIDTYHFEQMMLFFDWIVNKNEIVQLDTDHRFRLQGGLAERFFGVYMAFAYEKIYDLSLIHHWNDGLKEVSTKYCKIVREDTKVGLMSVFNTNIGAIYYWKRKGYEAIIENSAGHQWSKLFNATEAPSGNDYLVVKDIVRFRPDDNMEILTNPVLLRFWHDIYNSECRIRDEIVDEANDLLSKIIGNKIESTIGVLCRGTDYSSIRPSGHPRQPTPEDLFIEIDKRIRQGYEFIYLVTEDKKILEKFEITYGREKVLTAPQTRIDIKEDEYLSDAVERYNLDELKRDKEYLIAIYLLSRCKVLVAGRTSGTVAAMVISEGFEDVFLYNKGRYGDELEENLKYDYS